MIPPERRQLVTYWFLERNKFVQKWKTIAKARKVRMLGIEATMATPERAKKLGLNYEEWKRVMFDGCMADTKAVGKRAKTVEKMIQGVEEVRLKTIHVTN